jgi:hypothetical protein
MPFGLRYDMTISPVQRKALIKIAVVAVLGVVATLVPGVSDAAGSLINLVSGLLQ